MAEKLLKACFSIKSGAEVRLLQEGTLYKIVVSFYNTEYNSMYASKSKTFASKEQAENSFFYFKEKYYDRYEKK